MTFLLTVLVAVIVAILDTGIAEHPHFANTVISGDRGDSCGHGTAMAGIVVDQAPRAELLSIDIDTETICRSSYARIAEAIGQATDAGADVILVAWSVFPDIEPMALASAYAAEHGATVVFSHGLEGSMALAPRPSGDYFTVGGTSVTAAIKAGQLAAGLSGASAQIHTTLVQIYKDSTWRETGETR